MAITLTFPSLPGLANETKRSPALSTIRHRTTSGRRTIVPQQTIPIWTWELPYSFLRTALFDASITYDELDTLIGFFNARAADGMCFRYQDPDDVVASDAGFGEGDGVTTQFQLYRAFGGFAEPVYLPTISELDVNGVPTTDYTVSDLGVVTFNVAPLAGQALTWTGIFDWLVRFEVDTITVDRIVKGLYQTDAAIRFSNEINP